MIDLDKYLVDFDAYYKGKLPFEVGQQVLHEVFDLVGENRRMRNMLNRLLPSRDLEGMEAEVDTLSEQIETMEGNVEYMRTVIVKMAKLLGSVKSNCTEVIDTDDIDGVDDLMRSIISSIENFTVPEPVSA